jgi:hypothetical protein
MESEMLKLGQVFRTVHIQSQRDGACVTEWAERLQNANADDVWLKVEARWPDRRPASWKPGLKNGALTP